MPTLQELFNYRTNGALKEKVAAACWKAAKTIFLEADTVLNHAERLKWAVRALRAKDSEEQVYSEMLIAVVTLKGTDKITDTDIESTVLSVVDKFVIAGV